MAQGYQLVSGKELAVDSFHKAASLFNGFYQHVSIKGVLTGVVTGRVFLSGDGKSALLLNPQGLFLGGCPENTPFWEEVNSLIAKELLPSLASGGQLDYVLYYSTEDERWEGTLQLVMTDLLPLRSGRMTFTHDLNITGDYPISDGIVPIDRHLLHRRELVGADLLIKEILGAWPSLEAYLERGFGCAAVQDTDEGPAMISWCSTDWVVGDECELGIETTPGYRGKGWARRTAMGALALAKQRGITRAGWQCWSSNIGSQRTALSVGFELLADFPVLFGWNHPIHNLLVNGNHYMRGDPKYGVDKDYARAAWSYAEALDQGWDWGGSAYLYWNAACMFYLTGEKERAHHYYRQAIRRGWVDIYQSPYHEYVYRDKDSDTIANYLAEACQ